MDNEGNHISEKWSRVAITSNGDGAVVGGGKLYMGSKGKWRQMTGCFEDVTFGKGG